MYNFHTKNFSGAENPEAIDEWLNSFWDRELTNSQQSVAIERWEQDRHGNPIITVKVFKAK